MKQIKNQRGFIGDAVDIMLKFFVFLCVSLFVVGLGLGYLLWN